MVPKEPESVINEVTQFYHEKNIVPRFYIYNLEQQTSFIEKLKSNHFRFEASVTPVQIWNKVQNEQNDNDQISIEKVTEVNFNEALAVECSIKELGGREVREKAFTTEFHHPSFTYYLLRYNGTACSTASIFEYDNQARMESVATLAAFRGKGLIGALIHFLQREVQKRGFENFWVFPINERVEKVYAKYGFETIGKINMGHAFLSGKSFKEIWEG